MPMFRSKPAKKRRKDPYPRLGTPEGDASIGPCTGEGCDRQLRRGDLFWCMMSGATLCIDCYSRVPGIDLATCPPPSDPPPQAAKQPETLIWDGAFPE